MCTKRRAHALGLAALLGLLEALAAGCVAPATQTPTPAATAPAPTTAAPTVTAQASPTVAPSPTTVAPTATTAATAIPTAVSPAAGTAALTASPAATAAGALTATPCAIGTPCVANGVDLTVREVETPSGPVQGLSTPQPGRKLVLVDVTLRNTGTEPLPYRPNLFRLRTQDGAEDTACTITPDESGSPGPGEVALLRVVFEVPEGARDFTLIYAPPTLGGRDVRVNLTQSQASR